MKSWWNIFSKTVLTVTLLITLLLQTSCSWIGVRHPAAKKAAPAITADDVFSIEASKTTTKNDLKQPVMTILGTNSQRISYVPQLSKDLPENTAFKIELDVIVDKYTIRILHTKNAFKDEAATLELGQFLQKLAHNLNLQHELSIFEMYYNAREGDLIALDNFLKLKAADDFYPFPFIEYKPDEITRRMEAAKEMREELKVSIKELKKERAVLTEKRKALMDKLDKAPDAKQFKALVAKNDRQGAADLLAKYLPFEEMAPFEKRYWETQLEIMRKPVPLDQRVLIYRGLEEDFLHIAWQGNKELDKDEALKESKAFVMSTVLVKNQGSWNRRLRSLEAMNDKFIATIDNSNEYSQSARISTMLIKHSEDPKGSPFLSFTPRYSVAQSFGETRSMVALMDPRSLNFNFYSTFTGEAEFLQPLVTFPDEVVAMWNIKYHADYDRASFFKEQLKNRIAEEYGANKADDIIKRIEKNSADYFENVLQINDHKNKKVTGGTMAAFYKKFAAAKDFKPAMTPQGNLTCKDILKIFWTVP